MNEKIKNILRYVDSVDGVYVLDRKEFEEILLKFGQYCCELQKEECSESALCRYEGELNKDSILNCKNVVDE